MDADSFRTPTSVILPTLSAFLRHDAASWFKGIVSSRISHIPLREDGVVQTVLFVASQFAPSLGQEAQAPPSNGPPITVQAIMQMSKLLSSVPQGIDPTAYFHNIAPKLLALLDSQDQDLKRAAAYIVGSGILGKRAYGAPGTVGHSIFIEPLLKAVTGSIDDESRRWLRSFDPAAQSTSSDMESGLQPHTLVPESILSLAIERLCTLSLQHPNPGLVKRLVQPILLPLWGLACYAQENDKKHWHEKTSSLLQTYFGLSVGFPPLQKLADNLLYTGGTRWTYGSVPGGGIVLVERGEESLDIVQLVQSLDSRADSFARFLGSDPQSEERTGDIFLYVSKKWLLDPVPERSAEIKISGQERDYHSSVVEKVVSAKLAEKLLSEFKDTLSRRPLRVLELVHQLIDSELRVVEEKERKKRIQRNGKPTLESLASIVSQDQGSIEDGAGQAESTESLSATFSLLSTILASPDLSISQDLLRVFQEIKAKLDQLIPHLPTSLAKQGTTSSMLLEIHLNSPNDQEKAKKTAPTHDSDFETHRQALKNINSDLPPVQAEGLTLLSKLITKSSPVLDIASTLSLLLSIITDQGAEGGKKDEFIYLNAIKLIGALASKHPRTVVRTLVERYADKQEERTLDQRLLVGESLLRTVQDLGEALVGEAAQIIGEGMIEIAGRRGRKPEAQKARRRRLEQERKQKEREEKANQMPPGWKITTNLPSSSDKDALPYDSDEETPEQAAQASSILEAWAAGAPRDEEPDDIRVRASALSILATAIQTNLPALGPAIALSAVDLALSILTQEPDPGSAILRRASVVLLLDLIKAMDNEVTNRRRRLGFGFSFFDPGNDPSAAASAKGPATIGNIPTMLRTLSFVESRESDTLVRGHIRVLVESLEAWMEKSLLRGIGAVEGDEAAEEPRLHLGDRLAGLAVDPLAATRNAASRPRIEEIED